MRFFLHSKTIIISSKQPRNGTSALDREIRGITRDFKRFDRCIWISSLPMLKEFFFSSSSSPSSSSSSSQPSSSPSPSSSCHILTKNYESWNQWLWKLDVRALDSHSGLRQAHLTGPNVTIAAVVFFAILTVTKRKRQTELKLEKKGGIILTLEAAAKIRKTLR